MNESNRARGFAKVIGQSATISRLKAFADLYRSKGTAIGHIILVGEDGMGKHCLSRAFAEGYGVNLRETLRASQIEWSGDLASLTVDLGHGDVLLLPDLDGLRAPVAEVLAGALKDFELIINVSGRIMPWRSSRSLALGRSAEKKTVRQSFESGFR